MDKYEKIKTKKNKKNLLNNIFDSLKRKYCQNNDNIEKIYSICNKLIRNHIYYLEAKNCNKTNIDLLPYENVFKANFKNDYIEYIQNFDYIKLNKIINHTEDCYDTQDSINLFAKPYSYYKLLEFDKAYNLLDIISKKYKKDYFIYSIAEFNKKALEPLISFKIYNYQNIDKENYECILKRIEQINIQDIFGEFAFLPYKKLLEDKLNFSYLNKISSSINKQIIDIQKTKDNVESGGWSFNNAVNDLYINVFNIFEYITSNFLFIDNDSQVYNLFYLFIDSVLKSYSTGGKKIVNCSKIENFDSFVFYIMIEYLKPNDLVELFKRYEIEDLALNKDYSPKIVLLNNFENLSNSMVELKLNDEYFWNKLNNLLIVFAKIEINQEEYSKILKTLMNLYSIIGTNTNRNSDSKSFSYLNYFLNRTSQDVKSVDFNILSQFFNFILDKYSNNFDIDLQMSNFYLLVKTITRIFKNNNKEFLLNNDIFVKTTFSLNNDDFRSNPINKLNSLIIPLYNFYNINTQSELKEYLVQFFNKYFSFELFYNACFYNIIHSNILLEKLAIDFINEKINLLQQEPHCINYSDDVKYYISAYASLIALEKVKHIKNLKPFNIKESSSFDFLVDMENFDFDNKFEFSFLISLPDKFFNKLIKIARNNPKIKLIIQNKFCRYIANQKESNYDKAIKIFNKFIDSI